MADDNRLGEKIVTLRTAHHLSSRDLADRCGCDVSVIEGLERGELPASLAPLIKITRALGVRLGTLMDDDENLAPRTSTAIRWRRSSARRASKRLRAAT